MILPWLAYAPTCSCNALHLPAVAQNDASARAAKPANSTLNWDVTPSRGTWLRLNYRGKSSDYLSRTSMAEGTPSFTFVDLGTNYQINKHLSSGVAIYNIFDKKVTDKPYEAVYDGRRLWAHMTLGF